MAQTLCDYCHQKPQYSNHKYCSKSCAAQATSTGNIHANINNNLCTQCHKKPKFQSFDFCGKTCATQAIAQRQASAPNQRTRANNARPAQPSQPAINPGQMIHLLAQQVPQVQALLAAVNGTTAVPTAAVANHSGVAPLGNVPQNNPLLPQQQVLPGANGTLATSSTGPLAAQQPLVSNQQPAVVPVLNTAQCIIPRCGKPVHTDAKGVKTSEYCSQRHREEAVTSGIVDPCIMCLKFPQGEKDFFCGKTCRDEAMEKMPQ